MTTSVASNVRSSSSSSRGSEARRPDEVCRRWPRLRSPGRLVIRAEMGRSTSVISCSSMVNVMGSVSSGANARSCRTMAVGDRTAEPQRPATPQPKPERAQIPRRRCADAAVICTGKIGLTLRCNKNDSAQIHEQIACARGRSSSHANSATDRSYHVDMPDPGRMNIHPIDI